ncbi:MAG TPA: hypothetical protein VL987_13880 [Cellvibrio sp.]|jgi:hypothetical protein|nr:hypothetical protein [Cellvibrio sp.]
MSFTASITRVSAIILSLFFVYGCATQITEQPSKVTRATVNLGEYKKVILVKSEIAKPYANQSANIKAVNKIDEVLASRLGAIFDEVEVKTAQEVAAMDFSAIEERDVLLIKPLVKQVKFIGGAARFWAGAMAGSSVVILDASFEEAKTGKQLSNPGFLRKAGAYTDAFGVASNAMLSDVAQDVANYAIANK